ncbi:MAG: FG-GAP repeat domain-containing protein, partial [Solirubrobacteraceae bacterium]
VYLVAGTSEGRATINDAARFVDDSWRASGALVLQVASARDLDGDGRADFVIAAMTDAALDVYLVYGGAEPFTGTLKLTDLVEGGAAARFSIALASAQQAGRAALGVPDVTGDGRDDLVLAVPGFANGAGALYVIPGDPVRYSGTLALPAPVAPLPRPVHAAIAGAAVNDFLGIELAAADLDGDGVGDLFVTSGGDAQVFYGPIEGVLSPSDASAHTDLGHVTSLAAADLDGDQDAELVVISSGGGYLFRGGPSRRAGALLASGADLQLGTSTNSEVRVGGDLDGDGHPDLVITAFRAAVGIVAGPIAQTGFLSLDDGSLRWTLSAPGPSEESFDVCLGDFNGDGFDDVAVAAVGSTFGSDPGAVQI